MIVLHAMFPIDPDRQEEAVELFSDLAERSRAVEGIHDYRVAVDVDDPNVIRFFEHYEDQAALDRQLETDHFAELEEHLPDLLGGEPDITRFDVESTSDVEL